MICPTPQLVPSGLYSISFTDTAGDVHYLYAVLNDPDSMVILLNFHPHLTWAQRAWIYDASAKTLSTGCGSTKYYLYFDPSKSFLC